MSVNHSGAQPNIPIERIDDRGLRSPRHIGYLDRQQRRHLMPFMAAPLRPGETLVGASIQGRSDLTGWIQLPNAPLMYGELALWIIPLPGLGDDFTGMLIDTAEDMLDVSGIGDRAGSAANVTSDARSTQGHLSVGMQQAARPWAGEIGGNDTTPQPQSGYMPYVSRGTWKVAKEHYDIERELSPNNDDLHDQPPFVEQYIRSVSRSMFDAGNNTVDPNVGVDINNVSSILEHLYILTQAEVTYPEYLAAHGIDPRKSSGISQLYMIDHGQFTPSGARLFAGVGGGSASNRDSTGLGDSWHGEAFTAPATEEVSLYHDRYPVTHYQRTWDTHRTKPILIDAPSVLLGTMVYWVVDQQSEQFGHMGISSMVSGAHWGNRAQGSIEESDFISVRDIYELDGNTPLTSGIEEDQNGGTMIQNLLNLYLNGDEVSLSNGYNVPASAFQQRRPGGTVDSSYEANQHHAVNSRLSVQLHIMSDLVGAE